ncbi:MAG: radical SAM family heme chaperone HemW [Clostridia bacterium]|nr:radical SAM family heme chaperone HemW [Clostridia bacterium]
MGLGIYVHIPFCIKKCNYCDYVSFPLPNDKRVAEYIMALKKEIRLWAKAAHGDLVETIYIGGGTPSLLSPRYIQSILRAIKRNFNLVRDTEITIEANPCTISGPDVKQLAELGINRVSLGVQAMDNKLLREMGRMHDADHVNNAVSVVKKAGIKNINTDLIYGLPGQTLDQWGETLENIILLGVKHVSAYGLTLEDDTPWGRKMSQGHLLLPGQDLCGEMYDSIDRALTPYGFEQYEISSFSKPGFQCKHNLRYWLRKPYIGIGLGAASLYGSCRYVNHWEMYAYLRALNEDRLPSAEKEELSLEQEMAEFMFLGLRTSKGVNAADFEKNFGKELGIIYGREINHFKELGFLVENNENIRLSHRAFAVANEIFLSFV